MEQTYSLPEAGFAINDELNKARDFYRNHVIPPELLAKMDQQTAELLSSDLLAGVVAVGQKAPEFRLPDTIGAQIGLTDLLEAGPVVISFYRGGWCPYCNIALRSLQQMLPELTALGASLVAISPQTPDNTLDTAQKNALEFHVLSDAQADVARAFGVAFEIPTYLRQIYENFGHPLPKFNGGNNHTIPIPATFVLDTHGVVRYRFANIDYTLRADPAEVLTVLRGIDAG